MTLKTPPPTSGPNSATVLVERIDAEATLPELKMIFKKYGRILEFAIVDSSVQIDRNLVSATITMQDSGAAKNAARELDGFELRGLPVRVSVLGESGGKDVESY
jgi:RNA recognition motif-containing protein